MGKFFQRFILILLFSLISSFGVFGLSCWEVITQDTFMTQDLLNCRYYGVEIGADNITLDCQGHTISGSRDDAGIMVPNFEYTGVKIRNCVVQNFKYGMTFTGDYGEITNNTFQNNLWDGVAFYGNDTIISNNIFRNNDLGDGLGAGLKIGGAWCGQERNLVSGNTMENNEHGINLECNARDNSFLNNVVANNGTSGFRIQRQIKNNVFSGNDVRDNKIGFSFLGDKIEGNQIFSNHITGNRSYGIRVDSGNEVANTIYNNYFDNAVNVIDLFANNTWNIPKTSGRNIIGGPYLGGNYRPDYSGKDLDGDGLGDTDTPYSENGNIAIGGDYLPLVHARRNLGQNGNPFNADVNSVRRIAP